jgi:putative ABC transport system permease protein
MNRLRKKLRLLWRRRQLERDLDDELQFHLDMKTEEVGDRAEAVRRIGNPAGLKETCRELWTFSRLESWWQDVRYAFRTLGRSPTFVLAAVAALSLGIGADTAIFTIANGAFSWNLGLEHVDRTVLVHLNDPQRRQEYGGVSYPNFEQLRARTRSLAGLAAYQYAPVNLSDSRGFPERCWRARMSANGFSVSEQQPVLGRLFNGNDERPGAPAVVVLTHHLWQDRYGNDPAILGKTIFVDDVPSTVIGVMPAGKRFPEDCDLWTPLTTEFSRNDRSLMCFGRLAAGVNMAAARSELNIIAGQLAAEHPATDKGLTARVQPIAEITGVYSLRSLFAALWVAVGFVLLIACADVANMLLARGAGRTREIAIRVAIGAGRARLVRQLLIESVLLAAVGGCLGVFIAVGGLRWFDAGTNGLPKPPWLHLSLDRTSFFYLLAVSIGTGILFGLAPALRLTRVDVHSAMKDGGQGVASSRRTLSMSNLLVAAQMALCIVLLAGAGLMIRSAVNLYAAPLGVDTSNVLTMHLNLPQAKYGSAEKQNGFYRRLNTRLASTAGVQSASVVSRLPFGGVATLPWQIGDETTDAAHAPQVGVITAGADYFEVMRVEQIHGRTFTDSDVNLGTPVALVNASFVAKYWPDTPALGKRLRLIEGRPWVPELTVVGVVPDIVQDFRNVLHREPLVYLTLPELPQPQMYVVARTRIAPERLAGQFRRAVQEIDPNLAVYDVHTLEDFLDENRLSIRLIGGMFTVFAGIALVLAALGLYAVIAHSISQRTQEIGVRMALGGTRQDILRLVFAQGLRPMALGFILGLPAALAVTRVLQSQLVGVSPTDPVTFTIAVVVLAAAGALGCAIPARRAMRVDPIVALRYE